MKQHLIQSSQFWFIFKQNLFNFLVSLPPSVICSQEWKSKVSKHSMVPSNSFNFSPVIGVYVITMLSRVFLPRWRRYNKPVSVSLELNKSSSVMTGIDPLNSDNISPVTLVLERSSDSSELPNFWKIFKRTTSVIFEFPERWIVFILELQLCSRTRIDSSGIFSKLYNPRVVRREDNMNSILKMLWSGIGWIFLFIFTEVRLGSDITVCNPLSEHLLVSVSVSVSSDPSWNSIISGCFLAKYLRLSSVASLTCRPEIILEFLFAFHLFYQKVVIAL